MRGTRPRMTPAQKTGDPRAGAHFRFNSAAKQPY
jgi:hypothetical protein